MPSAAEPGQGTSRVGPISSAAVTIDGMQDGTYDVHVYSTSGSGGQVGSFAAVATGARST